MITVSQNDYGYYITDTLLQSNGAAFDLAGYTVAFHAWAMGSPGKLVVNAPANVVSNANGTVRYAVVLGDFTIPGQYKQEWQATAANTSGGQQVEGLI